MTKEELEKESEEYFKSICGDYNEEYERTGKRHYWVGFDIKNAYIASAEPREKRIAELEATNKKISDECHKLVDSLEKEQKENADLKCECRRCVYTDSPCVLSDYGKDRNGICDHFKDVFDENAELKQENKVLTQNLEDTEILNKTYEKRFSDLEKKNAELKDKLEILISVGNVATNGLNDQLTKAKEHIENLLYYVKQCTCERSNYAEIEEDIKGAEQFLSEVEK